MLGGLLINPLIYILTYRNALNYGHSRLNAWSHLVARENSVITKQDDILISINQALQLLYLKHHEK